MQKRDFYKDSASHLFSTAVVANFLDDAGGLF